MAAWSRSTITRATFLRSAAGGLLATGSLAGCDLMTTQPASEKQSNGQGSTSGGASQRQAMEAPQLARQTAAGSLPPVTERLPEKPLAVDPVQRVGDYGGQWRTMIS